MCLCDPARASRPGRRDYSARLRDSVSDPTRGLGATYVPACLRDPTRVLGPGRRDYSAGPRDLARASGPGRHDYSARLCDSASDPARGLGAMYDPASLCDSARASVPGRWNYLESLSDLTQGFRVGVTESGSITMAISWRLRAGTLRGSVQ